MCLKSFTYYENCGCASIHATLPCLNAFDPSLPKCKLASYLHGEKVKEDCPECKPAFDNKSGRKPRITLNFQESSPRPQPKIMQEVHPRIKLTLKRNLISTPSFEMEAHQHQHKGTLAEIDQEHNQFRDFTRQEREDHKAQLFLDWLDDPTHPGSDTTSASTPSSHGIPISTAPRRTPKRAASSLSSSPPSPKRRRIIRTSPACPRGKITPSPPATPLSTMTQTISVPVRNDYTLRARHHTLTASQREAMSRAGYANVRRLSIVSRLPHRPVHPFC